MFEKIERRCGNCNSKNITGKVDNMHMEWLCVTCGTIEKDMHDGVITVTPKVQRKITCDYCKTPKRNIYDQLYDKPICNDCKDSDDYERWCR